MAANKFDGVRDCHGGDLRSAAEGVAHDAPDTCRNDWRFALTLVAEEIAVPDKKVVLTGIPGVLEHTNQPFAVQNAS